MPLRCPDLVQQSDSTYQYEGVHKSPHEGVIGFHNTKLESLVQSTCDLGYNISVGTGILLEGRLRYGYNTHASKSGVNVYSDGGLETFHGHTGWVQLEVKCTNTSKLSSGRRSRYCVRGPPGETCYKVALVALWVPYEEVPPMVRLS